MPKLTATLTPDGNLLVKGDDASLFSVFSFIARHNERGGVGDGPGQAPHVEIQDFDDGHLEAPPPARRRPVPGGVEIYGKILTRQEQEAANDRLVGFLDMREPFSLRQAMELWADMKIETTRGASDPRSYSRVRDRVYDIMDDYGEDNNVTFQEFYDGRLKCFEILPAEGAPS